jgi:hypothetical protein
LNVRNADTAAQAAHQTEQALTKLVDIFGRPPRVKDCKTFLFVPAIASNILNLHQLTRNRYKEVKAGLTEGINFYTNLQELLQAFNSKCTDFAMARDTEKTGMNKREGGGEKRG